MFCTGNCGQNTGNNQQTRAKIGNFRHYEYTNRVCICTGSFGSLHGHKTQQPSESPITKIQESLIAHNQHSSFARAMYISISIYNQHTLSELPPPPNTTREKDQNLAPFPESPMAAFNTIEVFCEHALFFFTHIYNSPFIEDIH